MQGFLVATALFVVACFLLASQTDNEGTRPKWKRLPFDGVDPDSEENIHLSHVCGTWQDDVIKLQNASRANSRATGAQRFLTFSCPKGTDCGGLGDNLVGLVSTFLISVLTRRAFVIDWPFSEVVFAPNAIDWRLSPDVQLAPTRAIAGLGKYTPLNAHDVVRLNLVNSVPGDSRAMQEAFEMLNNAGNILIAWNRGIIMKLLTEEGPWREELQQMGLTPPYAYGCLLHFLVRVKPEVRQLVQPYIRQLEAPRTSSICIHARVSDEQSWAAAAADEKATADAKQQLLQGAQHLFNCATRLTNFWFSPPQKVLWVFASSSSLLKEAATEAYADKVLVTDLKPTHTNMGSDDDRNQAVQTSVAEWSLFSHCDLFIISDSGYSKTAALFALKPMSIYVASDGCEPEHPTRLADLAGRWSGV